MEFDIFVINEIRNNQDYLNQRNTKKQKTSNKVESGIIKTSRQGMINCENNKTTCKNDSEELVLIIGL